MNVLRCLMGAQKPVSGMEDGGKGEDRGDVEGSEG